jgi:hypothetical protein
MGLLGGMILVLLRMADIVLAGYNDFLAYGCPTRTVETSRRELERQAEARYGPSK